MPDLQTFRPKSPIDDDRHGVQSVFCVGERIKGANGATVTRIESLPEGVRVHFETTSMRYSRTYTPMGVVASADEEIPRDAPKPPPATPAPQMQPQRQQQHYQKGKRR